MNQARPCWLNPSPGGENLLIGAEKLSTPRFAASEFMANEFLLSQLKPLVNIFRLYVFGNIAFTTSVFNGGDFV